MVNDSVRSQAEDIVQELIDEAIRLCDMQNLSAKEINFKIWKTRVAQTLAYYFGAKSWQFVNFSSLSFLDTEYRNRTYHPAISRLKSDIKDVVVILERSKLLVGQAARIKNQEVTHNMKAMPKVVFISHGRNAAWRELQHYLTSEQKIESLELSQQPNRGRTVINKLNEVSDQCSYAVIVMTGDNLDIDGKPYARENVMHEIGFFQGKYGLDRVCILYENGTNIPSNLSGVVYVEFPKDVIKAAFPELLREIKAAFEESA
jgi:predicted nucleotide-binding protein